MSSPYFRGNEIDFAFDTIEEGKDIDVVDLRNSGFLVAMSTLNRESGAAALLPAIVNLWSDMRRIEAYWISTMSMGTGTGCPDRIPTMRRPVVAFLV